MGMKLILLGAPGAGKGTQAEVLSAKLNIPTKSTGKLLEAIKLATPTVLKAKSYMDNGQLVPDEVVIAIVAERLAQEDCANGFILDGMPRTLPQAEALDKAGVKLDHVLSIEISDKEIEQRMSGRRVCAQCGASYHIVARPTKVEGVCDSCGGPVVLRDDDKPETVRQRLARGQGQSAPQERSYQSKGLLSSVDNQPTIEATTKVILEALGL